MKNVTVFLFVIAAVCWAGTLFEDCFDDGNADGWSEWASHPDSADYYVQDTWYHFEIEQDDGYVATLNGDVSDTDPHLMSIPDYSIYCKVCAYDETQHLGVLGRWQSPPSGQFGYALWLRVLSNDVVLWRHDGSGTYVPLADHNFVLDYGIDYWMRFDLVGGLLQGKVWEGSLGEEPVDYLFSVLDYTYSDPGSMGVIGQAWGVYLVHTAVDSVMVFDPMGTLEQSTWAGIKSIF